MSVRDERLARNEAFFRELNERLEAVTPDSASELVVVCECADVDCADRLTLRQGEYEAIRAHDTHFVVAIGHVAPEIERIVIENERHMVVEKGPGERQIVIATDPRR